MARLLVVLVAVVLTSACGKAGRQTAAPSPTGSPAPSIAGITSSTANKLPDQFPKDFPLPSDYKVLFTQSTTATTSVYFEQAQTTEEVKAFFASELPKAGWRIVSCQRAPSSPGPVFSITAAKGKTVASLVVGYNAQFAARLKQRFSFLVSLAQSPVSLPQFGPGACP